MTKKYLLSVGAGLALGLSVQASASMMTGEAITSVLSLPKTPLDKAGPSFHDGASVSDAVGSPEAGTRTIPVAEPEKSLRRFMITARALSPPL
ncbi:hypothetical protein [Oceanicaulis sp.]|uniref:hypothetical protein n=1 Tax=Oceanicaulis sp. TaxID=1924941 RepID=UPI003BA8DB5B